MTTASLNDVQLVKFGPVTWTSTPGFTPSSTIVYVRLEDVDAIRVNVQNATLQIGTRVIENLVIKSIRSGSGAADEVLAAAVELVDRRWFLTRRIVTAAYNVRRKTGRLGISNGPEPIQIAQPIPELAYVPSTLNNGAPWTVEEAIDDIFLNSKFPFISFPQNFPDSDAFGSAGILETGYASDVLASMFQRFAQGFRFALKDSGEAYIYETSNISEEQDQLSLVQPALRGGGFVAPMDRRYERPSLIHVEFVAESEIRFDYDENQDQIFAFSSPISGAVNDDSVPPAWLESVVEVPIPGLDIYGFPAARGSLSNLYAMLAGLPSLLPPPPNNTLGNITIEVIKQLYFKEWEQDSQYVTPGGFVYREFGTIWRAINSAFRLNYRLSRDWVDRVRLIKPVLAELIDSISLTRRQSPVFSDFVSIPGQRYTGAKTLTDYQQVTWFQENSVNASTAACLLAPARITGADSEAKTFSVQYRRTIAGTDDDVRPAVPDPSPKAFNQENIKAALGFGPIKGSWKMATILTCLPYPRAGEKSHLHTVIVNPDDAAAAAGIGRARLGECLGPVLHILVPYGPATTARFAWRDDLSEQLRAPFFKKNARFPEEALQNKDDIDKIAKGYAAAYYYSLLDTYDGRQTTPAIGLAPELRGGMSGVTTSAGQDIITTSVQFQPRSEPINPYRFIPAEVMQRILAGGQ